MSQSEAEAQTQVWSRPCGLLGRAFAFPEGASYQDLTGGVWQSGAVATLEALPFSAGRDDLDPAFRGAETLGGGGSDRGPFQRAQRDLLERHLVRILAALAELGHRFAREDGGCVTAALASL